MWEVTFLRDFAVVLAASFPVLFLCRRLKLPQIVGFLVTGVAIGPHALGWVREARRVETIAEIGVALILLFVGLEFPIRRLKALGRTSLVGGSLQMILTAAGGFALARAAGRTPNEAVFFGLLVSVSSTAVVLPLLKQRDELTAPYGRRFLAVALFQDLAVIPILLFLPALVSGSGPGAAAVAGRVAVAIAAVALLVAVARRAAPRLLDAVARMGSRETFTGAVVVLVLVMIAAGERAGVSAAMGAFAAGIVLGESDHVHEVAATLAPLHDLLSSLFFVSVGMLLEPAFLVSHPVEVGVVVAVLVDPQGRVRVRGAPGGRNRPAHGGARRAGPRERRRVLVRPRDDGRGARPPRGRRAADPRRGHGRDARSRAVPRRRGPALAVRPARGGGGRGGRGARSRGRATSSSWARA